MSSIISMGTPEASEIQHPVLPGAIFAIWFRAQRQACAGFEKSLIVV